MSQLLETVSWQPLIGALVTCSSLIATLIVTRANRWLRKLLELERQANEQQRTAELTELHDRELKRHNETLRTLCSASETGERTTLESLLSDEQGDFSLQSSAEPSASSRRPPTNPGRAPPIVTSRASGSRRAVDWADDDEITEQRHPSSYPPPWPQGNKP